MRKKNIRVSDAIPEMPASFDAAAERALGQVIRTEQRQETPVSAMETVRENERQKRSRWEIVRGVGVGVAAAALIVLSLGVGTLLVVKGLQNRDTVAAQPVEPAPETVLAENTEQEHDGPTVKKVSAGGSHTVVLYSDGTAVAVGLDLNGQCGVSGWTDLVDISAGDTHTVGVKADGTVVAVGKNDFGQCNVSDRTETIRGNTVELPGWTDVAAVSAGVCHTVGLKRDGTAVAVGNNDYGQCNVSGWTDLVAVAAGMYHTVGLRADGTVVAAGMYDREEWESAEPVTEWTDITEIAAAGFFTVGLKRDGTVVAAGENLYGQCDVSDWNDIKAVAVAAGAYYTAGLRADGTVVAVGQNQYGQCDVSGWTDIAAISAGYGHTVGLKRDGTLVFAGDNKCGQCETPVRTGAQAEPTDPKTSAEPVSDVLCLFFDTDLCWAPYENWIWTDQDDGLCADGLSFLYKMEEIKDKIPTIHNPWMLTVRAGDGVRLEPQMSVCDAEFNPVAHDGEISIRTLEPGTYYVSQRVSRRETDRTSGYECVVRIVIDG